ncbi:MAG: indole-3-glycerol phosphate synthase TrpC [Pseudopedobacter sp.]|nr:indole-3-glycerol phosphate synthase TrpC [Deinococcales bacterium]
MKDFSVNLEPIEGILGQICRERAADYAHADFVLPPARARKFRFEHALTPGELTLIAEVKRASPSRGFIADRDPVEAALAYERGGAAALSILTEPRHFGGNAQFLKDVVAQVEIPALRKDFVVHPEMVLEASYWGASAVLLMVSILGNKLGTYLELAHHLGLDALVEVHSEDELKIAMDARAPILGINNRDLRSLEIDLNNVPFLTEIARFHGYNGVIVAESGYSSAEHIRGLRGLTDAVLIGSSLMEQEDLETAVRTLLA